MTYHKKYKNEDWMADHQEQRTCEDSTHHSWALPEGPAQQEHDVDTSHFMEHWSNIPWNCIPSTHELVHEPKQMCTTIVMTLKHYLSMFNAYTTEYYNKLILLHLYKEHVGIIDCQLTTRTLILWPSINNGIKCTSGSAPFGSDYHLPFL